MEYEIITKNEAIARGLNHYFTGAACKNGHVNRRYVQSSACVECVNGDKILTEAQREQRLALTKMRLENDRMRLELAQKRSERQNKEIIIKDDNRAIRGVATAAKSELIKMGFLLPYYDLPAMKQFVHGLASLRVPGIRIVDIYPNVIPKFRGDPCYFYYFMVHPDDKILVRQAADTFLKPVEDEASRIRLANRPQLERDLEEIRRQQQEDNNGDPGDTLENLMR